jgi:hypothetical protein
LVGVRRVDQADGWLADYLGQGGRKRAQKEQNRG